MPRVIARRCVGPVARTRLRLLQPSLIRIPILTIPITLITVGDIPAHSLAWDSDSVMDSDLGMDFTVGDSAGSLPAFYSRPYQTGTAHGDPFFKSNLLLLPTAGAAQNADSASRF